MKEVLVFRTSVDRPNDVAQLSPLLDLLMNQNEKWNFDLEDCDKILRVEVIQLQADVIIHQLACKGFYCAELLD